MEGVQHTLCIQFKQSVKFGDTGDVYNRDSHQMNEFQISIWHALLLVMVSIYNNPIKQPQVFVKRAIHRWHIISWRWRGQILNSQYFLELSCFILA